MESSEFHSERIPVDLAVAKQVVSKVLYEAINVLPESFMGFLGKISLSLRVSHGTAPHQVRKWVRQDVGFVKILPKTGTRQTLVLHGPISSQIQVQGRRLHREPFTCGKLGGNLRNVFSSPSSSIQRAPSPVYPLQGERRASTNLFFFPPQTQHQLLGVKPRQSVRGDNEKKGKSEQLSPSISTSRVMGEMCKMRLIRFFQGTWTI